MSEPIAGGSLTGGLIAVCYMCQWIEDIVVAAVTKTDTRASKDRVSDVRFANFIKPYKILLYICTFSRTLNEHYQSWLCQLPCAGG